MVFDVDRHGFAVSVIQACFVQVTVRLLVIDANQNIDVVVARRGLEKPIHFWEICVGHRGDLFGNNDGLSALRCEGPDLIRIAVQDAHALFSRWLSAILARVRGHECDSDSLRSCRCGEHPIRTEGNHRDKDDRHRCRE